MDGGKSDGIMRIAAYMRLSKEDDDLGESNSIRMQRQLLDQYAKTHFKNYEWMEFLDDGYTGTNFERPGVKELLEKVKRDRVDCIIVKDFSRFSRDYIELGVYMRQIFPFMGVRFISVNDNYDSCDKGKAPGDLDIAFKHLVYDLYSKDLSVKVKASLEGRKARGVYISSNCPFGYEKSAGDRHVLVIAEDEAVIVRKIFSLAMDGFTSSQIARQLNEEGIKTPIQFKMEKGKTTRSPKGKRFFWRHSLVCAILKNRFYVGDFVYGKYEKEHVGGKNHIKPKSEWKVICDHHEPIMRKEMFEAVQQKTCTSKEKKKEKSHFLVGKLVCGCCKGNLVYRGSGKNPYYYCNNRYINRKEDCVKKLNAMYAEEVVRYYIQEKADGLKQLEELRAEREKERGQKEQEQLYRIQKKREEIGICQRNKANAYEQYVEARKCGKGVGEARELLDRMTEAERKERSQLDRLEKEYEEGRKTEREWGSEKMPVGTEGEIIEMLVREIVVRGDEMEILWNESPIYLG